MSDRLSIGALHQVAPVTADAERSAVFYRDVHGNSPAFAEQRLA